MYNSSASYVFLIEFGFKKKSLNRNETARRAGKLLRERVGKLLFKGVKKFGKFLLLLNNLRVEIKIKIPYSKNGRQHVPKKPKGLSLGFQFFEYLGLGLGTLRIFCKFRKNNLNTKKKF